MVYSTKAYAKVNIGLKVTGQRDDGYHTISSYFLLTPFYDEIELSIHEGNTVSITGNESYIEGSEDLMAKAYRLYREETGLVFSVEIRIKKNIPLKAGLGGGSSDAAAILRVLEEHFNALGKDGLFALAISVGADVPFFLTGFRFAYVEGIGERIEERKFPSGYRYITLFRGNGSGVSTKEAYRKLDSFELDCTPLPDISYPIRRSDFPNDFEKIEEDGMLSELGTFLDRESYLSLSGSGSVWFLLSREKWTAETPFYLASKEIEVD